MPALHVMMNASIHHGATHATNSGNRQPPCTHRELVAPGEVRLREAVHEKHQLLRRRAGRRPAAHHHMQPVGGRRMRLRFEHYAPRCGGQYGIRGGRSPEMQHEEHACCRHGRAWERCKARVQRAAAVSLDAVDDVVLVSQAGAGVIKAQLRPVLAVEECPRPVAHYLMVSAHSCFVAHVLWCRLLARVQT